MNKSINKIAIFDLDNTIASWTDFAIPAYENMIETIAKESALPIEKIKSEMLQVYDHAGTIEYPPLIQEMPSLKDHPKIDEIITEAKKTFSKTKRANLKVFPNIENLLKNLTENGFTNIILTDAPYLQGAKRVKLLGLEKHFFGLIGLKSHEKWQIFKKFQKNKLEFNLKTIIANQEKPDTDLIKVLTDLLEIKIDKNFISRNCIYFGDNEAKDGELIKKWHMKGFLAKYGQTHSSTLKTLLEITPHHILKKHTNQAKPSKTEINTYKIIPVNNVEEIINHLHNSNYEISKI